MNARLDLSLVRSAVQQHKPLPTEVITLDLGELGCETLATVEYETTPPDVLGSGERIPAQLYVRSVRVDHIAADLLPFIQAQHRDCLQGIVDKLEEKLRSDAA